MATECDTKKKRTSESFTYTQEANSVWPNKTVNPGLDGRQILAEGQKQMYRPGKMLSRNVAHAVIEFNEDLIHK